MTIGRSVFYLGTQVSSTNKTTSKVIYTIPITKHIIRIRIILIPAVLKSWWFCTKSLRGNPRTESILSRMFAANIDVPFTVKCTLSSELKNRYIWLDSKLCFKKISTTVTADPLLLSDSSRIRVCLFRLSSLLISARYSACLDFVASSVFSVSGSSIYSLRPNRTCPLCE